MWTGKAKRPVVLLDVDGPLTPGYVDLVVARASAAGYAVPPPREWDVVRALGLPDNFAAIVMAELRAPGACLSFAPRPGALDFVRGLQKWADVWAATAPLDGSPTWAGDRELWLQRRVDIAPERVVSARDKSLIRGDALVDDKPANLLAWQATNPRWLAILWRETYNEADADQFDAVASSFAEVEWILGARI